MMRWDFQKRRHKHIITTLENTRYHNKFQGVTPRMASQALYGVIEILFSANVWAWFISSPSVPILYFDSTHNLETARYHNKISKRHATPLWGSVISNNFAYRIRHTVAHSWDTNTWRSSRVLWTSGDRIYLKYFTIAYATCTFSFM